MGMERGCGCEYLDYIKALCVWWNGKKKFGGGVNGRGKQSIGSWVQIKDYSKWEWEKWMGNHVI